MDGIPSSAVDDPFRAGRVPASAEYHLEQADDAADGNPHSPD